MQFLTNYKSILERVDAIDPAAYSKTRNFIKGAVTYLSPYISRGVISCRQIKDTLLKKGYPLYQTEKFFQELAWREYWQRTWCHLGDKIFTDIRNPQQDTSHRLMIKNISKATTGIDAIDVQISSLINNGYLHNHVRMYLAGITCNLGKAHWLQPSRWMYYHLLDGDIASNTLSWQWVAGSFSSKKYIANQENINKYLQSNQAGTFLDMPYEKILSQAVPAQLRETYPLELQTVLPAAATQFFIDSNRPLLLYNSYNIDPQWRKDESANRVLLLEPSHFKRFPVSEKVISFIIQLARENIPGIQIFTGEVSDLPQIHTASNITSIKHPLTYHYPGNKDPYPWMFPELEGHFPSFFFLL